MKTVSDKKQFPIDVILFKIQQYCVYQDRCQQEVRNKLYEFQLSPHEIENIIALLISEKFIDELRFAESYVSGKFRIKKWGKIKIIQGLKAKYISSYCIKKAITQIDNDDYTNCIIFNLNKKFKKHKNFKPLESQKAIQYMYSKGFETSEVIKIIKAD